MVTIQQANVMRTIWASSVSSILCPTSISVHLQWTINIKYHSAEQFIQREKSIYFKDTVTAQKILDPKTPIECKQLSQEISNYDNQRWKEVAEEICFRGINAKFQQTQNLCNILLCTGTLTLVESSYDSFWGTGIPLH